MQIARILWSLEVRIATGRTGWFDRGNHRKYSYQARCDHVCQTFAQTSRHDLHNHLHCSTSKFPDAIQRRKITQRDSTRNQLQNIFSRKGSLKFNHSYLSFKIGKRILRIKLNFDCIFLFYLIGESLLFKYKLCEESTEEGPFRKKNARLLSNSGHWVLLKKNLHLVFFFQVETFSGEAVQLVKMRNALGPATDYTGPWSIDSAEWSEVSPNSLERLQTKLGEGEFWISYPDFIKTFTHMEVIHLDSDTSRDEPSLHNKNTWQMRLYQGNWLKGVSAGGCRNNPDTFHINPQLHLLLSEMEEVVVSLNQHSIMEPKVIGFTAYSIPKSNTETIGKTFFKGNKSLFNSQYTNSRQVSYRCYLEQGGYLIIPTIFEPGQESGFTLRVYSSKPLKLKLLDTVPLLVKSAIVKAPPLLDGKSFSQYEAVFLQLADEHRTVNAFELQELLDACLPNDYIKSCASIEVCRQVILTFDVSRET